MKRIFIMIVLVVVALVLTGCASRIDTAEKRKKYAQLVMPDGTIVEGEFMGGERYSTGWCYYTIDGVTYWTDQLRLMIWEEQ